LASNEDIKQQLKVHTSLLQTILRQCQAPIPLPPSVSLPPNVHFPLATTAEMDVLNELLVDAEQKKSLVMNFLYFMAN